MRPQVLIATRTFGSTSEEPWRILSEAGCEYGRIDITSATEDQMIAAFENVDAASVGGRPITAAMIAGAFDHSRCAGIAHGKTFAGDAAEIALTGNAEVGRLAR